MIILDTNVLSELIGPAPAPQVVRWVDEQESADLAITSITTAELRACGAVLPRSRRRERISTSIERLIKEVFDSVIPFDVESSAHYAEVVAVSRRLGHPMSALDTQIAAICRHRGAVLATRNVGDFADAGIALVDPWSKNDV